MGKTSEIPRSARIQQTLNALLVQEKFTLSELRQRVPGEQPGYVTRIVHQLERDGHLRAEDGSYCWTCELADFPAEVWVNAQVHGSQLPESPLDDRPRERLLAHGAVAFC